MVFIRNRLSLIVTLSCLGLLGAIGWQGVYGHRNFEFRKKLQEQAMLEQKDLDAVSQKRKALEARVTLLRPGTMDADLVDEIARRDLNMGGRHDFVARVLN
jgi:cell division protein FtsB